MIPFPFVALCTNAKAFDRILKAHGVDPTPFLLPGARATAHTFENDAGNTIVVVTLDMPACMATTQAMVHALLAHEAVHIWQGIRERIGERAPSSEFEAYTVQYICTGLFLAYEELVTALARSAARSPAASRKGRRPAP
jgi:hypothetical protein